MNQIVAPDLVGAVSQGLQARERMQQGQARNRLAEVAQTSGPNSPEFTNALMAADPIAGARMHMLQQQGQREQADAARDRQSKVAVGLVQGVLSAPEGQRPQAYALALQQAQSMGMSLDNIPQEYPGEAPLRVMGSVLGMPAQERTEFERMIQTLPPDEQVRALRIKAGLEPEADGGPKPPPGYAWGEGGRLVPIPGGPADKPEADPIAALRARADAAGLQEGTPEHREFMLNNGRADGLKIESGPNGEFFVSTSGGEPSFGRAAENNLDEKIINTAELGSRLESVSEVWKPEFQELQTRAGMAWSGLKDKVGQASPDEQARIAEYTQARSRALNNLNQILKEMSGAAVTPQEFERIKGVMPNPGTGIFDGDSPAEFGAKLQDAQRLAKLALARYQFWRSQGGVGKPESLGSLEAVPGIMNRRGEEIAGQLREAGYSDEGVVRSQVVSALKQEFGI